MTPPAAQPPGDPARDPPRDRPRASVRLTDRPLSVEEAVADVSHPEAGGIAVFAGAVRDHHDGAAVTGLTYEAWEERAGDALRAVADGVVAEFTGVRAVHVSHRLGALAVGELSVVVAASAPHRREAFAAAGALIDRVKATVPIWKQEHLADGTGRWPGTPDAGAPPDG